MKTSFLTKAALILLTLTATTFSQAQISPEKLEHEEGRMEAAAFNQVIEMKKELDAISKKLENLQEEAGFAPVEVKQDEDLTSPSNNLVKALGEKIDMTEELKKEYAENAVEMQKQSGDELFKSYNKALSIIRQAQKNLVEAKKLVKLVK